MAENLTRSPLASDSEAKTRSQEACPADIALLTAGKDTHYAVGLAAALLEKGIALEVLGSDLVDSPALHNNPLVTFRNLRGDQAEDAPLLTKALRVLRYYARLIVYAVSARPRVFHILWNNKFEWFDRTALLVLYKLCGRKLVHTAHNVNIGERDGNDSWLNRWTLGIQYKLVDHIIVHTQRMKEDLQKGFRVPAERIHVIPYPLNDIVPVTDLDSRTARARLGLDPDERVLLAYGTIAPYKGLEYLVEALAQLRRNGGRYRLVIAGRVKKGADEYWQAIRRAVSDAGLDAVTLTRVEWIPDEETEMYFKAADVLVLSYTHIFQSGILFLGYNFGLPVIASDVGAFRESIIESRTGFIFRPRDANDLARTIERYFDSDIYRNLPACREDIRTFALQNYSWSRAASIIAQVYSRLLGKEIEDPRHSVSP